MKTHTLLVALDLEAAPEALAHEAIDLAKALSARVVLLSVLAVKPSVDADVLQNPAAHPVAAKRFREAEAEITPQLKAIAQSFLTAGIDVAAHVAHGHVADGILHVAERVDAGMILVGTHGRHGLARFALGSVAETVIRQSPIPVVTVRAGLRPAKDRVAFREISLDDDTTT